MSSLHCWYAERRWKLSSSIDSDIDTLAPPLDWKSYRMIMVVSTLWKLYDMVITARMKVCARVDPSMSTASKGVDARHNLHLAVDLVALQSSRGACLLQGVQDMERGFPTCERADVCEPA